MTCKPTRVANKNSSSCIDHIYIISFLKQDVLTGIIKTDLLDHFPIFIIVKNTNTTKFPCEVTKHIRIINKNAIVSFKQEISNRDK